MAAGLYALRRVEKAHEQTSRVTRGEGDVKSDDRSSDLISDYKSAPSHVCASSTCATIVASVKVTHETF